ncbi:hypothetical protein [Desulfatirhabdium butyrativorans]|uniref:hypothetical protein n=1 Tax=Desulfatirhabdium butyrativorans TaxID=340467 RepID=UPI000406D88A|nr:hypothetical protein [Desulfatirhabdium butyrativorans]
MHILIFGAGHFGKRAIRLFRKCFPEAVLTIVDAESQRLRPFSGALIRLVCSDAVDFLGAVLRQRNPVNFPDWIVPAVPIHLACEWIKRDIAPEYHWVSIPFPEEIRSRLPNPFPGGIGTVYTSIADFRCPDACPAPASHCTHTGLPRPLIMNQYLETIGGDRYHSVVIQSIQLGPGAGGYPAKALLDARDRVVASDRPVLLATACACHGVVDAFRLTRAAQTDSL